jgi:ribosome-binding protein aMBF1 (putative translation factor)
MRTRDPLLDYPIIKFTQTEYSKKLSYKGIQMRWYIANIISSERRKRNITQKELAVQMNTKQSVISRIENAKTYPSLSFLTKLAETLQIQFLLKIGK